jgi:hypothetical protein
MDVLAPMIGSVAIMLVFAWMLKLGLDHRRRTKLMTYQHDLQSKLLDKFSSTGELMEYLQGDAGQKFLISATAEKADPRTRILGSIQTGLVLLAGGVAFMFLRGQIAGAEEGFVLLGTIGIALGVGFVISAAVAYALSRTWGIINGGSGSGEATVA